ncbi:MAG: fibronectin type III domain-containing protein [Bacteroidaceae bacterium]|nr:fibronectin type III domain-containing protein [Bacteroidaceae bacterium]
MTKRTVSFAILLLTVLMSLNAQQLAFPDAEGFGAYASGGRGGNVVHVTNLNPSGAGSLAEAASKAGSFVVFDVGGVIDITNASITIASNVTIAGQTAPGEGITIYGGRVIASNSKNVIIRYLRMRGGKSVNSSKCTLTLDNCENLIMDHCSISWGPWDNVHIVDANNITWQYCIISEGIEPQRFGAITDGTRNWTIHHCLWANNKSRNPKMKCYLQYYNNVVYNYGMGVIGGHSAADNYQDLMNNYFIAGPNGSAKYFDDWTETDHMYSKGNYFDGNCDGVLNGTLITDHHGATVMNSPSLKSTGPQNLETARHAYTSIVEGVGASRVRDIHDQRIITHLTSLGKKGSFIANEDDVGGIGNVADGARITDKDRDGMADEWESDHGLNPLVNDANGYTLGNGYTNIENYVNSLAQTVDFLMPPLNVEARLVDDTTVELTWTNEESDKAVAIVVEQSSDGQQYAEIQRLSATATSTQVGGLQAGEPYLFRLKTLSEKSESGYSVVVAVNDKHMRAAGGMPAGTETFVPVEGYLYRILNYATVPYNSSTTLDGAPKYLTFNDNGTLGSTEEYLWNNPSLLWEISPVEGGFTIRNHSTHTYPTSTNAATEGNSRILATEEPSTLTINYVGDRQPALSGTSEPISMYRINCPDNKDQQLRARGFGDDWIWGSGTLTRADMLYTFVPVDASRLTLYLTKLNAELEDSRQFAASAEADVTLGYPSELLYPFNDLIARAEKLASSITSATTQDEVDELARDLAQARARLLSSQIMTLAGYSTEYAYNIYSYGTMPNASATNASSSDGRRFLYCIRRTGVADSLVYRIGLSEDQINAGGSNTYARNRAALWAIEPAEEPGFVRLCNQLTGSYLQIANTLSDTPVAIRPYYAKNDLGHLAYYLDATAEGNRCFNVGQPDSDGKGGPLEFFNGHADRVRLRWVFEATTTPVTTAVSSLSADVPTHVVYYNLQGMQLTSPPRSGIYIVRYSDGRVVKIKK